MALSLIGCGATLPKVKPYKMDIQQGNVVTSDMLLKLRPGMTKSQVKFIMGTPLLVDSFRTNRWDYFYQLRKQGKIVSQRRVILDFENDLLKRVRGDVVPKGQTAEDVKKALEQEAAGKSGAAATGEQAAAPDDLEVKPVETPVVEAVDEAAPIVEADPAPEQAAAAPAEDAVEQATEQVEVAEEVKEAAEVPATVEPEVPAVAPEVEAVKETSEPKEEPVTESVPVIEAAPAVEPSKKVLEVLPEQSDDRLIFRMDRSLDTTRIIPTEVSASQAPLQESVVKEIKEVEDAEAAEEPGFFERMLEKIGF